MDPISQQLMMGAAGSGGPKLYVEDVFSTWLYTGNGSTQTITNGIDLSGKGGLVWLKDRVYAGGASHNLYDTVRGALKFLNTDSSSGESSISAGNGLTSFTSNGFSLGTNWNNENRNGDASVSWTFRKAAKFFDVVTYTGDDVVGRTVSHNLGSAPGCMIIKRTDATGGWIVYHRSLGAGNIILLNSTGTSSALGTDYWNNTAPTSTVFTLGGGGAAPAVNASGGTYVAYLFAHDAGGFGDSGNDNAISCGSFTDSGAGASITLGWEPQWVLVKRTNGVGAWHIIDNMRGWPMYPTSTPVLYAHVANAEQSSSALGNPTPTGFSFYGPAANADYIYIAIRRGPMKTPTDATKVFQPTVYTGNNVDNRLVITDIVTDMVWLRQRDDGVFLGMAVGDRLRGQPYLRTDTQVAQVTLADAFDQELVGGVEYGTAFSAMNGFWVGNNSSAKFNFSTTANNQIAHAFRRAPGVFDIVIYSGTDVTRTVAHNLGVAPELMIIKTTATSGGWFVYPNDPTKFLNLDSDAQFNTAGSSIWNGSPTSTGFGLKPGAVNSSGNTYIAYLFATCPGVSKIGSYTGTGTTLNVDCGFTNGSRLVLIKRTDSTGDWYVWDSARGIVTGNDPYLLLSTADAEVTNTDYIDPLSSGFQISSTAPAAINANGGSFIYLAIA